MIKKIHDHVHYSWDKSIEPIAHVAPGEVFELDVQEASGGRITQNSCHEDVLGLDPAFANPVTGPIYIDGAEPGDALVLEMLDYSLSGWGWTALIPEFGLLAEDFPDPYLHLSQHDQRYVHFTPDIKIPLAPFPGTIGVALNEGEGSPVLVPHRCGGNIDCRHVVRGSRLLLPVECEGALLSIGDSHALQSDGEVCGTAVESPMGLQFKVSLLKQKLLPAPQLFVPKPQPQHGQESSQEPAYFVTMGIEEDLFSAAQSAIRQMIEHINGEYGLTEELSYCLCSLAVDLRINEIVNRPNYVVGAYLRTDIF